MVKEILITCYIIIALLNMIHEYDTTISGVIYDYNGPKITAQIVTGVYSIFDGIFWPITWPIAIVYFIDSDKESIQIEYERWFGSDD